MLLTFIGAWLRKRFGKQPAEINLWKTDFEVSQLASNMVGAIMCHYILDDFSSEPLFPLFAVQLLNDLKQPSAGPISIKAFMNTRLGRFLKI